MKQPSRELLNDLKEMLLSQLADAKKLLELDEKILNARLTAESWSILECVEHLNLYGDFYLAEISQRIKNAKKVKTPKTFKSGLLGNYFAKMMLPRPQLNKMKTFKDKDPMGSELTKSCINRFLGQQEQMLDLLEHAAFVDLNKIKTSISISNFIKLKLGDTFRVVIYHNQRHMEQAKNILHAVKTVG